MQENVSPTIKDCYKNKKMIFTIETSRLHVFKRYKSYPRLK